MWGVYRGPLLSTAIECLSSPSIAIIVGDNSLHRGATEDCCPNNTLGKGIYRYTSPTTIGWKACQSLTFTDNILVHCTIFYCYNIWCCNVYCLLSRVCFFSRHDLAHVSWFRYWLEYADSTQPLTTAGDELDDLNHDLPDLSELWNIWTTGPNWHPDPCQPWSQSDLSPPNWPWA